MRSIGKFAGCMIALGATTAWSSGASTQSWTADALMNLKTVHDPQITSDGLRFAYIVRAVDWKRSAYGSTVHVGSVGQAARPVAGHHSDSSPRWSPDGSGLALLSRRDGKAQIYLADGRKLTNSQRAVESFKWSHDGRQIGYLAEDPLTGAEMRRLQSGDDARVGFPAARNTNLYVVSIVDGASKLLHSGHALLSFDWSPDGKRIVYAAQASPRARHRFHADIYELDLATGKATALVVQPGQDLAPAYSRDGRYIAFYSQCGSLSFFGDRQVGVVPSGGGKIRYVSEKVGADVFNGAKKFWWSDDGTRLLFGAGKGTGEYLFSVNPKTGDGERLPYTVSDSSAFSISNDGSRLAYILASAGDPADLAITDLRTGRELQRAQTNPDLTQYAKVKAETVRWRSTDGVDVEGVLRLPFNPVPGKPVPLLVSLHGGPTGAALEKFPVPRTYPTQLFLNEGYAVFEPNFRGSIHYGAKFRLPLAQHLGQVDMDDVMTGIDMLVEKGIADPNRLGVMGWSYGGYLTSWLVGHTSRFKAASIGACAMDWISYYGSSVGEGDGPPEVMDEYFGGQPWLQLDAYYRHSPRPFVKNIKTPSLLLRGERDDDSISELALALEQLQVPMSFVTYPREPHGIGEPVHQKDLLERNLAWFKKWIPTGK